MCFKTKNTTLGYVFGLSVLLISCTDDFNNLMKKDAEYGEKTSEHDQSSSRQIRRLQSHNQSQGNKNEANLPYVEQLKDQYQEKKENIRSRKYENLPNWIELHRERTYKIDGTDYTIDKYLGEGTYGKVYGAKNEKEEYLALKFFKNADDEAEEIEVHKAVMNNTDWRGHRHIVKFIDTVEIDGFVCIAMEYLYKEPERKPKKEEKGATKSKSKSELERIANDRKANDRKAIASAVKFLSDLGFSHDTNFRNRMRTKSGGEGVIKLIDLGQPRKPAAKAMW